MSTDSRVKYLKTVKEGRKTYRARRGILLQ
jgi:hypothetical protein